MTRQQLIERIANAAGPLGPFRTLLEFQQEQEHWLAGASLEWVDLLLDILVNPPEITSEFPIDENWNYELGDILVRCGELDPLAFLRKVGPFLRDRRARQTLIWVIGDLHRPEGLDWLEPLLDGHRLIANEYDELVYACEEIRRPRRTPNLATHASACAERDDHGAPRYRECAQEDRWGRSP